MDPPPSHTHRVYQRHTHTHTPFSLCRVQPHSSNVIMFIQQIDDDYVSFHSPLRQKIDTSDWWSSTGAHLFIHTDARRIVYTRELFVTDETERASYPSRLDNLWASSVFLIKIRGLLGLDTSHRALAREYDFSLSTDGFVGDHSEGLRTSYCTVAHYLQIDLLSCTVERVQGPLCWTGVLNHDQDDIYCAGCCLGAQTV